MFIKIGTNLFLSEHLFMADLSSLSLPLSCKQHTRHKRLVLSSNRWRHVFRSLVNAVSVDISGEELLGSVLKPFERGSLCPLYAKLRDLKIKPLKVNEF